jgi:hypothetical protein
LKVVFEIGERVMASITKDQAVRKIKDAIPGLAVDDLVQVYNDIFYRERATEEQAKRDARPIQQRIDDYIQHGLEMEQVLDLWSVIFPEDRNVYYDTVSFVL